MDLALGVVLLCLLLVVLCSISQSINEQRLKKMLREAMDNTDRALRANADMQAAFNSLSNTNKELLTIIRTWRGIATSYREMLEDRQ